MDKNVFKSSLFEFKDVKKLVLMGMLAAISVCVGFYSINVTPYLRIGFSTLVNQVAYAFIGPIAGAIYGFVIDFIKATVFNKSGYPYNPIFCIPPVLAGFIYGLSYYKHKITFLRILITQFIVVFICNILIMTFLLSITNGKAFMVILPLRALKNIVQWPINSFLFFLLINAVERSVKQFMLTSNANNV